MATFARLALAFAGLAGFLVTAQEQQPDGVLISTTDPAYPGCTQFVSYSDTLSPNCVTETATEETSVTIPVATGQGSSTSGVASIDSTGTTTSLPLVPPSPVSALSTSTPPTSIPTTLTPSTLIPSTTTPLTSTSLSWSASFTNSSIFEPSTSEPPTGTTEVLSSSSLTNATIPNTSASEIPVESFESTSSTSLTSIPIATISTVLSTSVSTTVVTSTSVVWVSSTSATLSAEPSTIDHTTTTTTTTTEPALTTSSSCTSSFLTASESPDGQVVGLIPASSMQPASESPDGQVVGPVPITSTTAMGKTTVSCGVIGNHVSTEQCITWVITDPNPAPAVPTTFSTLTRGEPESPDETCISTSGRTYGPYGNSTITGNTHPHHTKSKQPMSGDPTVFRDPYTVTTTVSGSAILGDVVPGMDGSITTSWHTTTKTEMPETMNGGGVHTAASL